MKRFLRFLKSLDADDWWIIGPCVGMCAGLIVVCVLALTGVFDAGHAGEHCIQKTYEWVSHGKTSGYDWVCTKWAKS